MEMIYSTKKEYVLINPINPTTNKKVYKKIRDKENTINSIHVSLLLILLLKKKYNLYPAMLITEKKIKKINNFDIISILVMLIHHHFPGIF